MCKQQIQLINYLKEFITEKKFDLFKKIIENRTSYLTVVLEDIYQPHNASAVLRSCDCYGIQNVHIIENKNDYRVNPDVALGSDKWLNLHKHNSEQYNTKAAIEKLRGEGYRIIATALHEKKSILLPDFELSKGKCAIFLGSELNGLSDTTIDNADEYLKIPMYGFTESFNISVSAAIILSHLTERLKASEIQWQLSSKEKHDILLMWLKRSIKKVDLIIDKYNEMMQSQEDVAR